MRKTLPLALALTTLVGCATPGGQSGDRLATDGGWCPVSLSNQSGRPLALRYYTGGLGTGEVVVGEVGIASTVEFSALCELGTIRVLG